MVVLQKPALFAPLFPVLRLDAPALPLRLCPSVIFTIYILSFHFSSWFSHPSYTSTSIRNQSVMPLFKRNPVDGSAGPGTGSSTANTNMRSSGKSLLPKWMLGLRALQWLLAILVLGLACYAQHIYKNTGVRRTIQDLAYGI